MPLIGPLTLLNNNSLVKWAQEVLVFGLQPMMSKNLHSTFKLSKFKGFKVSKFENDLAFFLVMEAGQQFQGLLAVALGSWEAWVVVLERDN